MKFSYYIPVILAASAIYSHSALSSSLRAFDGLNQNAANEQGSAAPVDANGLYVNQSGNDAFNGAYETPFQTLEAALKKIKAGNTVYLSGGTYVLDAPQAINAEGTESEKITIKALDKSKPVIFDARSLASDKPAISIDGSYINFEDMHVMGATSDAISVNGDNVALRGNVIADAKEAGIRVSGEGNNNITLEGNEVKKSGSEEGAVIIEDAEDVTVKNNHIYDNQTGILLSGTTDAVVEENILNDNAEGNVILNNSDNAAIEKNEFFTSDSESPAPAIVTTDDNSNITVSNNLMQNMSSALMQKKDDNAKSGAVTDSVFDQNTLFNMTGDVAATESPATGANDVTFSNNIIKNMGEGNAKPQQGVQFNNNCVQSVSRGALQGTKNVAADISLKDTSKPASTEGNVVSEDGACETLNAGAVEFKPINFVDSNVTLPQEGDTQVASGADSKPLEDDTKVSPATDEVQDDAPDSQMTSSASDTDVSPSGDTVNSGATNAPSGSNASPFSAAAGMNNADLVSMIQQLVSEIVSSILNSIFGASNATNLAQATPQTNATSAPAAGASQPTISSQNNAQPDSQSTSQSTASDSTNSQAGEAAGSSTQPLSASTQQQQPRSSQATPQGAGSSGGGAPTTVASNSASPNQVTNAGQTTPQQSSAGSSQPAGGGSAQPASQTSPASSATPQSNTQTAGDAAEPESSEADASENNGVTSAPVEDTVNDVEIAQDGNMTESDIFIPSAGDAAITNDFACDIDWASKEASADAEPLEDCKVNEYRTEPKAGDMSSPSWASGDFSGKHCRKLSSDGTKLEVDMEFDGGGFDTSILSGSEESGAINHLVDDVPAGLKITNSFSMQMQGEGFDWFVIGPKVGIWPCQKEEECPDTFWPEWNENYIVEYGSRTPQEEDERLRKDGGEYLGETTHEGSVYKHYRTPFSDWTQYWSIRQDYRLSGTVTIKHFLDVWRKAGMPNTYVQKIQANFESGGKGCAKLTIEDVLISKVN